MKQTQQEYITEYMEKRRGKRISIVTFTKLGVYRYGAVFHRMRKLGYVIEMREKSVKHPTFYRQRHIEYRLV